MTAANFDLNFIASMLAKLGNICEEFMEFYILASNVAKFGQAFSSLVVNLRKIRNADFERF